MKIALLGALLFALPVCATPTSVDRTARSSPEDLRHFVAVAQALERSPLYPGAKDDRAWAIDWLTNAPDVTVEVCLQAFGGIPEKAYPHGPEIMAQYMFSLAAFIIQHPEKNSDQEAQQLAGVEGALVSYQAIRAAEPKATSAKLDNLLTVQARGGLPDFVRKAYAGCRKYGRSSMTGQ